MFAIDQPYTIALIASVIISLSMAVAALLHKHTLGVHAFAVLKASIGLWAFSSMLEICSQDIQTKIFSYSFKYLFIVIVPIAWFIFGLYYSNRICGLRRYQLGRLAIIPVITLALVATNRYHHWMFTSLDVVESGSIVFIVRKFGVWFWVHATYCYLLLFLGFFFMAKQLSDSPAPYRWQIATLLISGLTPWIANIAFIFNLTPYPYLDMTPFAFTISGLTLMWGIMRFQLLEVEPIANEMIIQNIEDAILVVDSEHRILNLNRAAENLIDLAPDHPIGNRAPQVFSWWPNLKTVQTRGAEPQIIDLFKNGRRRLLRMKEVSLCCNQRKIGILITLTEVTDTLLAKEALLNSERRFRSLSENAPVIIFALDTLGIVTYLNPAWEKILGHGRDDIMGRSFIDLLADTGTQVFSNTFEQLINGQVTVAELDFTIYHKMGAQRLFNASVAANTDNEGRVTGIIGLVKDITEERKLQHQLFQSQKMEAIGTLAGGVAHDFNNLLMGMQANLSLMRLDEETAAPYHDDKIQRIENQIQSGASLTRKLLGYARKGQYVVITVDMNRLIGETLNVVQRANKNITVQCLFSDDGAHIKADRGQMEMVLLNLFLNAVDAMPDGGRLTVSCRHVSDIGQENVPTPACPERGYIEIMVSDTGTGMDQATQDRIFEPFFTTKAVGRGSGLGLASVYGVVHNHGGSIQMESALGQGTTFTLFFPAAKTTVEESPPNSKSKSALSGSGKILLVEDEILIQKYCREMIKSLGFDVVAADNGDEAVRIYKEQRTDIDLVILDMIMPGMDGFSVFNALQQINPDVKVIITSGYTVDRRMNQILCGGPHGYLKKPYTLNDLASTINEVKASAQKTSHPNNRL